MAIPGPRKPGQTGGSGHGASKFTSVRRGGRPSAGRGGKPPKKGGGLCVQIAPQAAVPALMLLGNAIVQSFL